MKIKLLTKSMLEECLILSETISPNFLPFDPPGGQLFLNNHFNGSKTEVFKRYCEYHEQDPIK